jgi:hypothetical protein
MKFHPIANIFPLMTETEMLSLADHITDILRLVRIPIEIRISVPYESQQCNAQMIE